MNTGSKLSSPPQVFSEQKKRVKENKAINVMKKPPPKIADHHLGDEVKGYPVFLMDIDDIRPTEETDPENLAFIKSCLIKDHILQKPLAIERNSHVLMDGHHRYSILRSFGCQYVPVVAYDYGDVKVVSWVDGKPFDHQEIIKRGLAGHLFPAKTTRHIFPVDITCNIPLAVLTASTFKDQ
jgi:L-serine kinase (ADP)